ncbi:MAG TPA: hypothetical protein VKM94_09920 [Blastocatellia bacterium]|nr:hypothetical protein [Blastocatellia bacterium]
MKMSRVAIILALFCLACISGAAAAQQQEKESQTSPVAQRSDVYCTGYISDSAPQVDMRIVGAEKETIKYTYSEGDVVFLNRGRGAGVKPGAMFYVIRPVGVVNHPFAKKKLGFYVRELGLLRVLEVQEHTATAEVSVSCDLMELGDVVRPYEEMKSPGPKDEHPLARYGEGSGGTNGQIVMAPGYHENLSANRVVFVDLGNKQDVHPGDYFTIYRDYSNQEGITKTPQYPVVEKHSKGYGSKRWKGGEYSIQAPDESREEVLKERPKMPRKVVGELVIIKCENNTSVGMITRTTAEVNIGDRVERSN